jgi:hypothetical protein
MKSIKTLRTFSVATILSLGLVAPSFGEDAAKPSLAREVDTCISAIYDHLDLLDATRVRHVVSQKNRTGSALVFEIETSVFKQDIGRYYEAFCVANGDGKPSRFRITEKTS